MATQVIDLSSDKNVSNASPISMIAFMICFLITNMVMEVSFLYFVVVVAEFLLCQIFFQFTPRMVFLTIKFLFIQATLSPTIDDKDYYADEYQLKNLKKVLKPKDQNKQREQLEASILTYLKITREELKEKKK